MDILQFMKRKADLHSLAMSAGTVLAGTAAAVIRGNMEVLAASLCLIFALVTQTGCNLHHYYRLMQHTLMSESMRSRWAKVDDDPVATRLLREGSMASFLISLTLGLAIMTMAEGIWWTLVVAVLLYGTIYLMSTGPFSFRNPLTLIVTFMLFGPIGVMGTALVQFQHEAAYSIWSFYDLGPSIFMSVVMGLLACSHHLVLSYFNTTIGSEPMRQGCVKTFGRKGVAVLVGISGLLVFATAAVMVLYLDIPKPLVALLPGFLAFALNSHIALNLNKAGVGELRHLNFLSQLNMLLTGLLFFIIWWVIGSPDDSMKVLLPG